MGFLVLALVLVPFVYWLGPTTLVDCSPGNPFDRFGVWAGRGAHVDGMPGGCSARHPATWIAIGVTTATGVGLSIWALRRH